MKELSFQVVGDEIWFHIHRNETSVQSFETASAKAAIDEAKKYHASLGYSASVRVYTPEGKFYLDLNDDADVIAFILKYTV